MLFIIFAQISYFQALTVFLRENWERGQFEIVEATLKRDPTLGLGITVAGYVHKKGSFTFFIF